jgi:hypothetical protein
MKKDITHREPAVEHRPMTPAKQRQAETESRLQEVVRRRIQEHRQRKASVKKESGDA